MHRLQMLQLWMLEYIGRQAGRHAPHVAQGLGVGVHHVQVVQRVGQAAAHEELHGHVVHPLGVHVPAMHQHTFAHWQDEPNFSAL